MAAGPPVVLIVAKDRESLAMYAIGLLAMGFNAVPADNADVAFARACQIHPDAVVADLALSGVSGFELTRRLRDDARTQSAAIILIGDGDVEQTGGVAGCDRFVMKPCLPDALCLQVRDVLASRRGAAPRG